MGCNGNWWCIYIENLIAKEFYLTKQTHCGVCDLIPLPEIYPLWVENDSGLVGHSSMPQLSAKMNGNIVNNDIAGQIVMKQIGIWPRKRKLTSLL